MNSNFSFFLACIFCSLQMRSTSTALLGSSSVLTLCSFWLCGKICTLSPLDASYDACEANDIALSNASLRKPVVSIKVALIPAQTVKMHKNFVHLKYSFILLPAHGPAQMEWARTGLIGPKVPCKVSSLYPILQPVKVGHTTGLYIPYSFRTVVWVLLRPTRTDQ